MKSHLWIAAPAAFALLSLAACQDNGVTAKEPAPTSPVPGASPAVSAPTNPVTGTVPGPNSSGASPTSPS
ncbi:MULTISPECIES: hypothetical protein [unclassified Acidisoma]|jgi:hypothetical protein|uniref:hypothetical protein n=1 Tax=unclassified Acidisoma TaxID=2634065 RepID=UPI00131B78D2|nr:MULTISPECIES: hypothetical protein [unclassified Acidisoma]